MTNFQEKNDNPLDNLRGTYWFRRLYKEVSDIDPYIRFKRLKYGFWRIYWKQAYIHEVYEEMPIIGYMIDEVDDRFENQKYYEEYEDNTELIRKIKNYVEGYWDSINKIKRRIYLFKNNQEFYQRSINAYKQIKVK